MCCCSLEQLAYLTTTRFVCQYLFSSFSNFFNFSNCLNFSFISNASLSYHKLSCLSTTFFTFFQKFFAVERRWRDLNPRAGRPTYTLSRGASSATWVHLLAWKFATKVFDFHCYWSAITSVRGLVYQKKIHLSRVFLNFFKFIFQ